MQNSHKKPHKGFYAKSRTQAMDAYEYDPSQTSSYENHHYQNKYGNTYKYSKSKKHYPEYTYQPVKNQHIHPQAQHFGANNSSHIVSEQNIPILDEKLVEIPRNHDYGSATPVHNEGSKPRGKGDKKPEKQLYNARRKYAKTTENNKGEPNPLGSTDASSQSQDSGMSEGKVETILGVTETMEKKREIDDRAKSNKSNQASGKKQNKKDGKERLSSEEDKSFLSNVSTAISEKAKQNENETSSREKPPGLEPKRKGKKAHRKLLANIMLERDNFMEKIKVFEDEEDYDVMLDQICKSHNFRGHMALYFKINMLRMIYDMHCDKSRVEPALNRNLAFNAKLVLYEHGLQEIDDSIRSFLSSYNTFPC